MVTTLAFAGMIVILGLWGFFAPRSIAVFVRSWSSVGGMWLAIALRVMFGGALWFAAPLSRTEFVLKLIAGLAAASAVVIGIIGLPRFSGLIERWLDLPPIAVRAWCLVAIFVGAFVFWSTMRPITFVIPENPVQYR